MLRNRDANPVRSFIIYFRQAHEAGATRIHDVLQIACDNNT